MTQEYWENSRGGENQLIGTIPVNWVFRRVFDSFICVPSPKEIPTLVFESFKTLGIKKSSPNFYSSFNFPFRLSSYFVYESMVVSTFRKNNDK